MMGEQTFWGPNVDVTTRREYVLDSELALQTTAPAFPTRRREERGMRTMILIVGITVAGYVLAKPFFDFLVWIAAEYSVR